MSVMVAQSAAPSAPHPILMLLWSMLWFAARLLICVITPSGAHLSKSLSVMTDQEMPRLIHVLRQVRSRQVPVPID